MGTTGESVSNVNSPARTAGGTSRSSLGEQTHKVAEDVRELGSIAMATAGDALTAAKERGGELVEKGGQRVKRARDGVEGYVKENPFKSVLFAASLGALLGYTLRRRG